MPLNSKVHPKKKKNNKANNLNAKVKNSQDRPYFKQANNNKTKNNISHQNSIQ